MTVLEIVIMRYHSKFDSFLWFSLHFRPVWVLVFISKRDWYQSLCGFETELITLSLSRSCVYHPKSNLFGHFLSGKLCPKSDNFIYKYYLNVKCMKVKKVKCMKLEWSIGWLSLDTIYHGLLRTVPLWKEGLLPISIFRSFYIESTVPGSKE